MLLDFPLLQSLSIELANSQYYVSITVLSVENLKIYSNSCNIGRLWGVRNCCHLCKNSNCGDLSVPITLVERARYTSGNCGHSGFVRDKYARNGRKLIADDGTTGWSSRI